MNFMIFVQAHKEMGERIYLEEETVLLSVFLKWNLIGLRCKFVKESLKCLHQKEIRKRYDVLVINL